MSSAVSMATKSTVPIPAERKKVFSVTRSWGVASACAPGATSQPSAASCSLAAAGTFSNS